MIDVSYELHVALDTEVPWDSVSFLQRCLLLHPIFVGPCYLFNQHNSIYIWLPNGSSPLVLFEGTQTSAPLSPLSTAEHFSDLFQPLSSPLEKGAENEQATDFLLGSERELSSTVFANKKMTCGTCINLQNQDVQHSQSWIAWAFQGYKSLKKNKHLQ